MTLDDAPFYLEMLNDPDFVRFIGDRGVRSLEAARAAIHDRVISRYEVDGFNMFLVEAREHNNAVGMAGLIKRDFLPLVDVGYSFLPEARGQGFATEAASACVTLARNSFGCSQLAAITNPDNAASERVLYKLGFRLAGTVSIPDDGSTCHYFLLNA